ncbi:MAG: hypothetical protein CMJ23_04890 [Phycisphaerae bacterium]|nr:hypothetical protein [Phycisphaerae bacterium]
MDPGSAGAIEVGTGMGEDGEERGLVGKVAIVGMDLATRPAVADDTEGASAVVQVGPITVPVDDVPRCVLHCLESRKRRTTRKVAKHDLQIVIAGRLRHEEREVGPDIRKADPIIGASCEDLEAMKVEMDLRVFGGNHRIFGGLESLIGIGWHQRDVWHALHYVCGDKDSRTPELIVLSTAHGTEDKLGSSSVQDREKSHIEPCERWFDFETMMYERASAFTVFIRHKQCPRHD